MQVGFYFARHRSILLSFVNYFLKSADFFVQLAFLIQL